MPYRSRKVSKVSKHSRKITKNSRKSMKKQNRKSMKKQNRKSRRKSLRGGSNSNKESAALTFVINKYIKEDKREAFKEILRWKFMTISQKLVKDQSNETSKKYMEETLPNEDDEFQKIVEILYCLTHSIRWLKLSKHNWHPPKVIKANKKKIQEFKDCFKDEKVYKYFHMCGKKVDLNNMPNMKEDNKNIIEMKDTFNNIFNREEITEDDIQTFESLHADALSQSKTETNTGNTEPAESNGSNKPTGTETLKNIANIATNIPAGNNGNSNEN